MSWNQNVWQSDSPSTNTPWPAARAEASPPGLKHTTPNEDQETLLHVRLVGCATRFAPYVELPFDALE
jgi:hypothetical protein